MNENEKNIDEIISEDIQFDQTVEETVSEETVPVEELLEETVPEETVSEETVSEEPVSEDTVPEEKETLMDKVNGVIEKVKGMDKKTLTIGGAIAAVVVIALILALTISTPMGLIGTGLKNSINALQKNNVVSLVDGVVNGGSIEVSAELEELTESMMGFGIGEGTVSAKLYTDLENSSMAVVAGVKDGKETLVDGGIYVNEQRIAIQSEALLGKTAYGVNLKKLVDNFNDSEFGPDGEYSMGIEMNDDMKKMFSDTDELTKETEKMAKAIVTELLKSLKKNSDVSKDSGSISFAGKKVKTTAVTIEMDGEQMYEVIVDMLDYVRNDKAFKKYLTNYLEYALVASGEYYLDELDEDELEEMIDSFYENLEDLDDDLDYLKDSLEDADVSVKVTFHITKSGKQLVGIEVKAEADGDKIKGSVYAGPSLKDITEISYSFDDGYDTYRGSYTVKTNDGKKFEAKLKIGEDYTGKITHDKKSGEFKAEITNNYWEETYGIEGTLKKSGKKVSATIASVYEDEYETELNLNVVLKASDKMPSVSKYTDVLTMDVDEIETVVEEVQAAAMELAESFY